MNIVIIAALAENGVIGAAGKIPWHISNDLKRFKRLTLGHPVIMGRKTFESILSYRGKPLPDRTNIVVTRDPNWKYEGVLVYPSLEEALAKAKELDAVEVHIGGGAEIYKIGLKYIDKLYLTLIDDTKEADTFFPPYKSEFTKKTFEEAHEWKGVKYRFIDLEHA